MKIVFYSSNSNIFEKEKYFINTLPSWSETFLSFQNSHTENDYFIVTQKPGLFFLDESELSTEYESLKNQEVNEFEIRKNVYLSKNIEKTIISLKPDIAINFTFWVSPYDWLPVKDSLIAENLRNNGIKVISHPVNFSYTCFDKYETQKLLKINKLKYAEGILVNHDLYFCAGNRKEIQENVYKTFILNEIKKLKFPLIIKDTTGLSSYGMQVVNTYGECCNYLNSKRNNSSRLVEEKLEGLQLGCEIYGVPGKYTVLPPFIFSVNQYGITSPKQSVKLGPVDKQKFNFEKLETALITLAENVKLSGVAQVDLVYKDNDWYVIEINPRFSGMSSTYAASANTSIYEFSEIMMGNKKLYDFSYSFNIKFPLLEENQLQELIKNPDIKYICQTEDKAATQIREQGYCEVIGAGFRTKEELYSGIKKLRSNYPEMIEESFVDTAEKLIDLI